jgi:hypothetical protein
MVVAAASVPAALHEPFYLMTLARKNPNQIHVLCSVFVAGCIAMGAMSSAIGADLGNASVGNGPPLGIVSPGISYHPNGSSGAALFAPFDGFMFCTNVHASGNSSAITFYPEHRASSGGVWGLPAVQDVAGFRYGAQGGSAYLAISRVESTQAGDGKPSLICHPVNSEGMPFSPLADGVMRSGFDEKPFSSLPPMSLPNEFVKTSITGVDSIGQPASRMMVQVNGTVAAYMMRIHAHSSLVPSRNISIHVRDAYDSSVLSASGQYCGFSTLPDPGNINLATICEAAGAAVGNVPASGLIDVDVSLSTAITSRNAYVVVRRPIVNPGQQAQGAGETDGLASVQPIAGAAVFSEPITVPGYGDVADQFVGDNVVFGFQPGSP